jgi:hypothetical protein
VGHIKDKVDPVFKRYVVKTCRQGGVGKAVCIAVLGRKRSGYLATNTFLS